jgi:quercetin dioxygenase-like cupin family protein
MVSLVLVGSAAVLAQDPLKADPAHYKLVLENASVRVLKIDYPAGAKSQMHQHPEAIIIPLSNTKVRFALADGKSEDAEFETEAARYAPAGTHSPANIGTGRIDGLLVEFKGAAPGKAALPATRPGLSMKVLAEGARGMAYRTTADPSFQEPAGSKHDYDQVVVALGPGQMSLSIDGKPAKTTWARGDVQFIPRGVAHESKNAGGKPIDFIIVAVK